MVSICCAQNDSSAKFSDQSTSPSNQLLAAISLLGRRSLRAIHVLPAYSVRGRGATGQGTAHYAGCALDPCQQRYTYLDKRPRRIYTYY